MRFENDGIFNDHFLAKKLLSGVPEETF